jgi:hypothetical protein
MTKPHTILEMTRIDAQNLHRKISANMASAEHATWADVKALQADINALVVKMKTLVAGQTDDVKAGITSVIIKLEAAGQLAENKAMAATDGVRHANAAMLESVRKATQSLSAAVAAARTGLAHAIEPKKVNA